MYIRSYRSLEIPFSFEHLRGKADDIALLDSGATENFMDTRTAKRLKLHLFKLNSPRVVRNMDGTENRNGSITEYVRLRIKQGSKDQVQNFYITNLGQDRTILGFPWFRTFNPTINWHRGVVEGPAVTLETPIMKLIHDTGSNTWVKERLKARDNEQTNSNNLHDQKSIHGGVRRRELLTINGCERYNNQIKQEQNPLGNTQEKDWHIRKTTTATQWAAAAHRQQQEKPPELPEEYARHWRVFDDTLAQRFPPP
jgi:gag-polyprotein putative aspartyl protease